MTAETGKVLIAAISAVVSIVTAIIAMRTKVQLTKVEHSTNGHHTIALAKISELEVEARIGNAEKIARLESEILQLRAAQQPPGALP